MVSGGSSETVTVTEGGKQNSTTIIVAMVTQDFRVKRRAAVASHRPAHCRSICNQRAAPRITDITE